MTRSFVRVVFHYVVLITWSLIVLFPIYWLAITSFKSRFAVFHGPNYLPWVDFQPTADAWKRIVVEQNSLKFLLNSLICSTVSTFFALFLGSLAAYAVARFKVKIGPFRNKDLSLFLVSQRMMPPIVTVLALFMMLRLVRLLDTQIGLIFIYTAFNLPIAFWLMRSFIGQIPAEIEDAARLDASSFSIYFRILLPLAVPGMVATFFLCWLFAWNEFIFALILTYDRSQTLPILLASMHTHAGPQWWDIATMSLWAIIPAILITVLLQKRLIQGLLGGFGK